MFEVAVFVALMAVFAALMAVLVFGLFFYNQAYISKMRGRIWKWWILAFGQFDREFSRINPEKNVLSAMSFCIMPRTFAFLLGSTTWGISYTRLEKILQLRVFVKRDMSLSRWRTILFSSCLTTGASLNFTSFVTHADWRRFFCKMILKDNPLIEKMYSKKLRRTYIKLC